MKKLLVLTFAALICQSVLAKKVKFEVDMTDQEISPYGVHVAGDFQALAGFPGGDWQPGTTELLNEPGTQIYSLIVDIPAFAKYEYKFINGDQWYETEFVPWESRVGYNFNDNRWIFVDSVANDTTSTHPILFGGNAPAGMKLLRFKVDLQKVITIDPLGVHVAGTYQGWDLIQNRMYDFDTTIYEYMAFVETGNYEYKFYNGTTTGDAEVVPADCAVNGNRWIEVTDDIVLEVVCFSECSACVITQLTINQLQSALTVYPNPSNSYSFVGFDEIFSPVQVLLINPNGTIIRSYESLEGSGFRLETTGLSKGMYLIKAIYRNNSQEFVKLIVE